MSEFAIKVENLSKAYQLGDFSTGTLSRDIERWWALMRGKEDPFLKIGETNDRTQKSATSDIVWSLKDINFEISQGDSVGIIGRNGAGKSTLLKILSRVTSPTTGLIKINGRIASLLEVGTGFHPDLTGRENIFLNGAILGMRKAEIKKQFDAIVDFAGIARYIDTPVKKYSSGMYVRLAFAVAAHLESEILIVDEVLAVGDAEFQKKCLGKMNDVSKGQGRTVLFVSHNMGMVSQLCNKGILLENGHIVASNFIDNIISRYLGSNKNSGNYKYIGEDIGKDIFFGEIVTINNDGLETDEFGFHDSIRLKLKINIKRYKPNVKIGIALLDKSNVRVFTLYKSLDEYNLENLPDIIDLTIQLPPSVVAPNQYSFLFALFVSGQLAIEYLENKCYIKIHDTGTEFAEFEGLDYGHIIVNSKWTLNK